MATRIAPAASSGDGRLGRVRVRALGLLEARRDRAAREQRERWRSRRSSSAGPSAAAGAGGQQRGDDGARLAARAARARQEAAAAVLHGGRRRRQRGGRVARRAEQERVGVQRGTCSAAWTAARKRAKASAAARGASSSPQTARQ